MNDHIENFYIYAYEFLVLSHFEQWHLLAPLNNSSYLHNNEQFYCKVNQNQMFFLSKPPSHSKLPQNPSVNMFWLNILFIINTTNIHSQIL